MKEVIRLLVVDSKSSSCKEISKKLMAEPQIQIIGFASNGYEAITKSIAHSPDIVYMNIYNESEMASIYACREINVNVPSTKVILCAKIMQPDNVFKAFKMGAENVLIGDCTNKDVIDAILNAFHGKSSIHYSTAGYMRKEFKRLLDLNDNMTYVLNVLVKLTATEINILRHFYNGMSSAEICKILFIANTTMKTHISHILKKFNLESMTQVVEALHSTEVFSMINPYFDEPPII